VLTIDLERALALLAEPKTGRGRRAAAKPLRELGAHPEDSEPVNIYDGPYGSYIKHGKVNASLPEGQTVEALTMEEALAALAAKAATKKAGRKSAAASSSTTKKAATSQTKTAATSKKETTKKTTVKASTTKKKSTGTSTRKKTEKLG
jgi:DNA topoisomerase I